MPRAVGACAPRTADQRSSGGSRSQRHGRRCEPLRGREPRSSARRSKRWTAMSALSSRTALPTLPHGMSTAPWMSTHQGGGAFARRTSPGERSASPPRRSCGAARPRRRGAPPRARPRPRPRGARPRARPPPRPRGARDPRGAPARDDDVARLNDGRRGRDQRSMLLRATHAYPSNISAAAAMSPLARPRGGSRGPAGQWRDPTPRKKVMHRSSSFAGRVGWVGWVGCRLGRLGRLGRFSQGRL